MIAGRIKELAKKRGWSLHRLALECGYTTHSNITNLLRRLEVNPAAVEIRTVERIATALNVTARFLMLGDDASETSIPPTCRLEIDTKRVGDLQNWPYLLAAAKQLFPTQPWVWIRLAQSYPVVTAELNVATVVHHAKFIAEHETPPPPNVDPIAYWNSILSMKRERIKPKSTE